MPGMMDTVLNLGLNDTIVLGLANKRGERFAYDCYRWGGWRGQVGEIDVHNNCMRQPFQVPDDASNGHV